jgi:CubicO group peptidase (beta-lactamase class C family)
MENLTKKLNSNYGIIITKNNTTIYEKYVGNNKDTKFRIFSCSKPITAIAIFILLQQNKLNITDTIDKFNIKIPYSNQITINHLLNHTSGMYDFSSELYFNLNPNEYFNKISKNIVKTKETELVDFETMIDIINQNEPYFKPHTDPFNIKFKKYNNTGYDILGYIIYVVSNLKTNQFIQQNIFNKLKMKNSSFQHNKDPYESIPYDNIKIKGIKEQQNWYCGNANIVCTLQDYNIFLSNYNKLLNEECLILYHKLYYFGKTIKNNTEYNYFWHRGSGDFSQNHLYNKKYNPLSKTIIIKFYNNNNIINIIVSENYQNTNGFFSNDCYNFNYMIDNIII